MIPDERTGLLSGSNVRKTSFSSSSIYGAASKMAESRSMTSDDSRINARIVNPKHRRDFGPGEAGPDYLQQCNSIQTTKYTILTFLPKNLFEQFHRVANIYFVAIVCLNAVPALEVLNPGLAAVPILFVLSVTAVKDIYEDRRRYVSDCEVNQRICSVYNDERQQFEDIEWRDVCVGDLVQVEGDGVFPADLLLVYSSDQATNICFVETSNLDGETNLKQRIVPKGLDLHESDSFNPGKFSAQVRCEVPNEMIYNFNGYLVLSDNTHVPLGKDNLLLRGCTLRNTRRAVGMVIYAGHETKSMLNNSGPPPKRSKLERNINTEIILLVLLLLVLCGIGSIGHIIWINSVDYEHVIYLPFFADEDKSVGLATFFIFLSLIIALQVLVPISLYISIEFVKVFQVLFLTWDKHFYSPRTNKRLLCRALNLNEDLGQIEYVFADKTGTLTENEMIFRRCNINGREYPHSPDVSPNKQASRPLSAKERRLLGPESDPSVPADYKLLEQLKEAPQSSFGSIEDELMLVLALCNTVVTSNRSVVNGTAAAAGNGKAKAKAKGASPQVTPASTPIQTDIYEAESPDELALVLAAQTYGYVLLSRGLSTVTLRRPDGKVVTYDVLNVLHFDSTRKRMSIVVRLQGTTDIKLLCKGADSAIYSCFSHPSGAKNFPLHQRTETESLCSTPPVEETRADATQRLLDMYARQGLRTLCMASRVVSEDEYGAWLQEHEEAELAFTNREELVRLSACRLEHDLELLGATGIEDRLQDKVAETIAALRAADMNVWVLTGDKQETAINVAYSCRLIDEEMEIIILNSPNKQSCEEQLTSRLEELHLQRINQRDEHNSAIGLAMSFIFPRRSPGAGHIHSNPGLSGRQRALVVDGKTLQYLLSDDLKLDFLQLAAQCRSVICCRSTPLQKGLVVGLVKDELKVMSLAVGDGANDVSMIQTANLGVGISGVEGQQAVMASDFAISRFHYLHRLLLVHGHWCYDRISRMILYFYYKNAVFVLLIFWFQIFNGWSSEVAIEDLYLLLYNLIFTSLPPVVTAILDQDIPADVLLAKPDLYALGQKDQVYNTRHFVITMLDAFWQSLALFFTAYLAYFDSNVGIFEFGTTQNTACVLTVLLHLGIETQYWTWIHHLSLWGSIVVYLAFGLIYNILPTVPPHFVLEHTIGTVEFWAVVFLSTFIALLPRLLVRSLMSSLRPNRNLAARMQSEGRAYR